MAKKERLLLIATTALLLFAGAGSLIAAPVVSVDSSISIAPSSIPVPETGDPNLIVGMNKVQISTNFSGGTSSVDQVVVQLTSSGGFNEADLASIRVWYEPPGGNGLFDNGTSIDDLDALSGGPYPFSGGTATIALNTTVTEIGASAVARFYVGVELKSTAATSGTTIAVQVTSLRQAGKSPIPLTPYTTQKPLDRYRVDLTATNIVVPPPPEHKQGESATVLKLLVDPVDPDTSAAVRLESIKLHAIGSPRSDNDLNSGGVVLYEDSNSTGTYEAGTDTQVASATLGAVTPAYATITPAAPVVVPPAGKTFFVIVNIDLAATIDNVIGLEIENPSTDITFADAYADEVVGPDYANVPANRVYVQEGYLLGTSAVPSPNTPLITIKYQDIPQAPVVTSIVPGANASSVDRTTTVEAIFSKPMKSSTINATNITLQTGATPVGFSIDLSPDLTTVTLTPSSILDWGTTYTVTIKGDGASGVQDNVDNLYMAANKVWSFSTPPAVPPVVLATSPVNAAIEVLRDSKPTATFSKEMDGASVEANFKLHDGTDFVTGTAAYDPATRTVTFTPASLPLPWGTQYTASIDVGAKDLDGLYLAAKYSWTFTTTAAVYPIVDLRNPAHGAIEVHPSSSLTATFSKDMDGSTFDTTTCLLFKDINENHVYDAGDTMIARSASLTSAQVVTIDPSADLEWNTTYTVNITTGVRDAELLYMQSVSYWFFTTMVLRNPTVLGYSPAANAKAVPRSTSIVVAFSKKLKPATVNASTFFMVSGGVPVPGVVSYDDDTATATFDPDSDLAFATYTVTVKGGAAGVLDNNDMQMAADVTWSFTTRPSLTEPVAANNRITPGSANPVMIFIPQPTANPADRVTVQVFTVTGKKVATLINNQPWSSFEASLPLRWYGKNGLGQDLGPGLYFIQIRAPKYLRTLKVMIVR